MNDTERLLIAFAARVIDQARGNGYPGDIDGGWLQDTMTDMGVLEAVAVTEPCDETNCSCAECDGIPGNCYRLPAAVQLTLAEAEKPIPPHSAFSSREVPIGPGHAEPPTIPYEVAQLRETAKSFRADGDYGTAHLMERAAELLSPPHRALPSGHSVACIHRSGCRRVDQCQGEQRCTALDEGTREGGSR